MIFTMLISVYEMENSTKKAQIKNGLKNARSRGVILGRPIGSKVNLLTKYKNVVKELENGQSIRRTAKQCEVATSLVQRVKEQMKYTF
jgi:DNA invertase Pin-like site-specific DNA recombinase